jgi:mono/diheme cytochrome c family protein
MKYLVAAALILVTVVVSAGALILSPAEISPMTTTPEVDVKRGAYLARISGCVACHTETGGGTPMAGGVALSTKYGTFYSPNITPDRDFGIGRWSLEDFSAAVRHGVSPGGDPYYPAFPYPFYAAFNDRDIADLWAALQIVPPSTIASRTHDLGFPFNIRKGLRLWKWMFPPSQPYEPNPNKSASWNRGKLLAEVATHCGACHTPRNLASARITKRKYQGDPAMLGGGSSPAIDARSLIDAGWTRTSLINLLKVGVTPSGDVVGGSMAEVVQDGTAYLMQLHLDDLATFLLDQP